MHEFIKTGQGMPTSAHTWSVTCCWHVHNENFKVHSEHLESAVVRSYTLFLPNKKQNKLNSGGRIIENGMTQFTLMQLCFLISLFPLSN